MASGRDEVKQGVDAVVPEPRVTPNTRLLGENIIVLAFQVANNLLETNICDQHQRHSLWDTREIVRELIVNVVAKAWGVDDSQSNANAVLLQFCIRVTSTESAEEGRTRTNVDGLDPDTLFDMRSLRAIADFMLQDLRFAQGVHKRRAAGARSTCSMEGENAYHADASRTPKLR